MKPLHQITLRLPQDLAQRLAACTPSRKRNQFVVDLVRRELDRENIELAQAAMHLSALEAAQEAQTAQAAQTTEDSDWLQLDGADADWGEFDEARFCAELNAPSQHTPTTSPTSPSPPSSQKTQTRRAVRA